MTKAFAIGFLGVFLGICGCRSTQEQSPHSDASLAVSLESREDGTTWLVIIEADRVVLETVLSESGICEATLSEVSPAQHGRLDFDGDGMSEIVVNMWDGGNRSDTLFVFGARKGEWSQLGAISTPFDYEICDVDEDGSLDIVIPAKHGDSAQVFYLRDGRFVQ